SSPSTTSAEPSRKSPRPAAKSWETRWTSRASANTSRSTTPRATAPACCSRSRRWPHGRSRNEERVARVTPTFSPPRGEKVPGSDGALPNEAPVGHLVLQSRQSQVLLQLGIALELYASVEGFLIPYLGSQRIGLSVHTLSALQGIF